MQDLLSMIDRLSRPRLLVQAARFGLDDYNRTAALPRLLNLPAAPRSGPAILHLLAIEAQLDLQRRAGRADYPVARHVEVLIALMGEARLLRVATRAAPVATAAAIPPA